jgi:hypothetical protein
MLTSVRTRGGLVFAGVLAAAVVLGACAGLEDAIVLRDRAAEVRGSLEAEVARRQSAIERLDQEGVPGDDPARRAAEGDLSAARASHAAADAAVKQIDAVIAEAQRPTDPISQGVQLISQGLPEPARSPAVLGGALIVTLLRARQLRTALTSVARSIEQAKRDDALFRERFKANAATIRSIQTPAASEFVKSATGQGLSLRLPI